MYVSTVPQIKKAREGGGEVSEIERERQTDTQKMRESERDRANQRQSEREGKRLTERGRGTEKTRAKKREQPNTKDKGKLQIGQGREKRMTKEGGK